MQAKIVAAAPVLAALAIASARADVVVTGDDAGKTVTLHKGEPLVVKLVGRHGSGYYWRLDTDLTPELILSGRTTRALDLPGAPEETTFTFEAAAEGTVDFRASNLKAGAPIPHGPSDFTATIVVAP